LSPRAKKALRQENIRTLEDLRSVSGHLEKMPGIGAITARRIRDALQIL
jgi:transposase